MIISVKADFRLFYRFVSSYWNQKRMKPLRNGGGVKRKRRNGHCQVASHEILGDGGTILSHCAVTKSLGEHRSFLEGPSAPSFYAQMCEVFSSIAWQRWFQRGFRNVARTFHQLTSFAKNNELWFTFSKVFPCCCISKFSIPAASIFSWNPAKVSI